MFKKIISSIVLFSFIISNAQASVWLPILKSSIWKTDESQNSEKIEYQVKYWEDAKQFYWQSQIINTPQNNLLNDWSTQDLYWDAFTKTNVLKLAWENNWDTERIFIDQDRTVFYPTWFQSEVRKEWKKVWPLQYNYNWTDNLSDKWTTWWKTFYQNNVWVVWKVDINWWQTNYWYTASKFQVDIDKNFFSIWRYMNVNQDKKIYYYDAKDWNYDIFDYVDKDEEWNKRNFATDFAFQLFDFRTNWRTWAWAFPWNTWPYWNTLDYIAWNDISADWRVIYEEPRTKKAIDTQSASLWIDPGKYVWWESDFTDGPSDRQLQWVWMEIYYENPKTWNKVSFDYEIWDSSTSDYKKTDVMRVVWKRIWDPQLNKHDWRPVCFDVPVKYESDATPKIPWEYYVKSYFNTDVTKTWIWDMLWADWKSYTWTWRISQNLEVLAEWHPAPTFNNAPTINNDALVKAWWLWGTWEFHCSNWQAPSIYYRNIITSFEKWFTDRNMADWSREIKLKMTPEKIMELRAVIWSNTPLTAEWKPTDTNQYFPNWSNWNFEDETQNIPLTVKVFAVWREYQSALQWSNDIEWQYIYEYAYLPDWKNWMTNLDWIWKSAVIWENVPVVLPATWMSARYAMAFKNPARFSIWVKNYQQTNLNDLFQILDPANFRWDNEDPDRIHAFQEWNLTLAQAHALSELWWLQSFQPTWLAKWWWNWMFNPSWNASNEAFNTLETSMWFFTRFTMKKWENTFKVMMVDLDNSKECSKYTWNWALWCSPSWLNPTVALWKFADNTFSNAIRSEYSVNDEKLVKEWRISSLIVPENTDNSYKASVATRMIDDLSQLVSKWTSFTNNKELIKKHLRDNTLWITAANSWVWWQYLSSAFSSTDAWKINTVEFWTFREWWVYYYKNNSLQLSVDQSKNASEIITWLENWNNCVSWVWFWTNCRYSEWNVWNITPTNLAPFVAWQAQNRELDSWNAFTANWAYPKYNWTTLSSVWVWITSTYFVNFVEPTKEDLSYFDERCTSRINQILWSDYWKNLDTATREQISTSRWKMTNDEKKSLCTLTKEYEWYLSVQNIWATNAISVMYNFEIRQPDTIKKPTSMWTRETDICTFYDDWNGNLTKLNNKEDCSDVKIRNLFTNWQTANANNFNASEHILDNRIINHHNSVNEATDVKINVDPTSKALVYSKWWSTVSWLNAWETWYIELNRLNTNNFLLVSKIHVTNVDTYMKAQKDIKLVPWKEWQENVDFYRWNWTKVVKWIDSNWFSSNLEILRQFNVWLTNLDQQLTDITDNTWAIYTAFRWWERNDVWLPLTVQSRVESDTVPFTWEWQAQKYQWVKLTNNWSLYKKEDYTETSWHRYFTTFEVPFKFKFKSENDNFAYKTTPSELANYYDTNAYWIIFWDDKVKISQIADYVVTRDVQTPWENFKARELNAPTYSFRNDRFTSFSLSVAWLSYEAFDRDWTPRFEKATQEDLVWLKNLVIWLWTNKDWTWNPWEDWSWARFNIYIKDSTPKNNEPINVDWPWIVYVDVCLKNNWVLPLTLSKSFKMNVINWVWMNWDITNINTIKIPDPTNLNWTLPAWVTKWTDWKSVNLVPAAEYCERKEIQADTTKIWQRLSYKFYWEAFYTIWAGSPVRLESETVTQSHPMERVDDCNWDIKTDSTCNNKKLYKVSAPAQCIAQWDTHEYSIKAINWWDTPIYDVEVNFFPNAKLQVTWWDFYKDLTTYKRKFSVIDAKASEANSNLRVKVIWSTTDWEVIPSTFTVTYSDTPNWARQTMTFFWLPVWNINSVVCSDTWPVEWWVSNNDKDFITLQVMNKKAWDDTNPENWSWWLIRDRPDWNFFWWQSWTWYYQIPWLNTDWTWLNNIDERYCSLYNKATWLKNDLPVERTIKANYFRVQPDQLAEATTDLKLYWDNDPAKVSYNNYFQAKSNDYIWSPLKDWARRMIYRNPYIEWKVEIPCELEVWASTFKSSDWWDLLVTNTQQQTCWTITWPDWVERNTFKTTYTVRQNIETTWNNYPTQWIANNLWDSVINNALRTSNNDQFIDEVQKRIEWITEVPADEVEKSVPFKYITFTVKPVPWATINWTKEASNLEKYVKAAWTLNYEREIRQVKDNALNMAWKWNWYCWWQLANWKYRQSYSYTYWYTWTQCSEDDCRCVNRSQTRCVDNGWYPDTDFAWEAPRYISVSRWNKCSWSQWTLQAPVYEYQINDHYDWFISKTAFSNQAKWTYYRWTLWLTWENVNQWALSSPILSAWIENTAWALLDVCNAWVAMCVVWWDIYTTWRFDLSQSNLAEKRTLNYNLYSWWWIVWSTWKVEWESYSDLLNFVFEDPTWTVSDKLKNPEKYCDYVNPLTWKIEPQLTDWKCKTTYFEDLRTWKKWQVVKLDNVTSRWKEFFNLSNQLNPLDDSRTVKNYTEWWNDLTWHRQWDLVIWLDTTKNVEITWKWNVFVEWDIYINSNLYYKNNSLTWWLNWAKELDSALIVASWNIYVSPDVTFVAPVLAAMWLNSTIYSCWKIDNKNQCTSRKPLVIWKITTRFLRFDRPTTNEPAYIRLNTEACRNASDYNTQPACFTKVTQLSSSECIIDDNRDLLNPPSWMLDFRWWELRRFELSPWDRSSDKWFFNRMN